MIGFARRRGIRGLDGRRTRIRAFTSSSSTEKMDSDGAHRARQRETRRAPGRRRGWRRQREAERRRGTGALHCGPAAGPSPSAGRAGARAPSADSDGAQSSSHSSILLGEGQAEDALASTDSVAGGRGSSRAIGDDPTAATGSAAAPSGATGAEGTSPFRDIDAASAVAMSVSGEAGPSSPTTGIGASSARSGIGISAATSGGDIPAKILRRVPFGDRRLERDVIRRVGEHLVETAGGRLGLEPGCHRCRGRGRLGEGERIVLERGHRGWRRRPFNDAFEHMLTGPGAAHRRRRRRRRGSAARSISRGGAATLRLPPRFDGAGGGKDRRDATGGGGASSSATASTSSTTSSSSRLGLRAVTRVRRRRRGEEIVQ